MVWAPEAIWDPAKGILSHHHDWAFLETDWITRPISGSLGIKIREENTNP